MFLHAAAGDGNSFYDFLPPRSTYLQAASLRVAASALAWCSAAAAWVRASGHLLSFLMDADAEVWSHLVLLRFPVT